MLGSVGYFALFLEWFLLLAMGLPKFMETWLGKLLFPQSEQPKQVPPIGGGTYEPTTLVLFASVLLSILLVGLVMYVVLVKYTSMAVHATEKIVQTTAKKAVPMIMHKEVKKIPVKKRKMLTARVLFWLKLVLLLVPVGVLTVFNLTSHTVEAKLALLGLSLLACFSFTAFVLQHILWHKRPSQAQM